MISVCIATVRTTTVGVAVASVRAQTFGDWELIVVGQGRRDELETAVTAAAGGDDRVRYVHSERHGLSVARNVALRESTGDILASTDDDCEAEPEWLEVIGRCFAERPELGLVGGSLVAPAPEPGRRLSSCLAIVPAERFYDPVGSAERPVGFNWVGGNFALRRAAADRVGRFDELLGEGAPFQAAEDRDYLHRLEAARIPMLTTPRAIVRHTYGRRYGARALAGYWRGQGTGNGAVFAKLTMRGDPRGPQELRRRLRRYPTAWLRPREPGEGPAAGTRAPQRLVSDLVRISTFATAYRRCLRDYALDDEGLLRPAR